MSKTTIMDTINPNLVSIKDEIVPTGGNYQGTTVIIDAPPNSTAVKDISWPFQVTVYNIYFSTKSTHEGTILNVYGVPIYPVGAIIAPVTIGSNKIKVSSTALIYLQLGYLMTITDGINSDDLGMVLGIDKPTSTITTEKTSTHTYSPFSPTYVKMCVHRLKDFVIGPEGKYTIGKIKTYGAPIPPGLIIRTVYENTTNNPLKLHAVIEYTY
jgi:hypothetical protein